ncbi:MAG: hypothetical protein KKD77_22855 [Gammaproteobacteria bacterium]|nr:hypothetical protein [Gammaproteobacteria bacterium]
MAQDETYQTKTYFERPGNAIVFGSGGICRVESGGAIRIPRVVIGINSVSDAGLGLGVLSVINLPFSTGIVIFSAESNLINTSFWLTSVSTGADVWLLLRGDLTGTFTNYSTIVEVSLSGCVLLGSEGRAINSFEMHTSGASDCFVHLESFTDGVWSIVGQGGDINE